jgi:hypothetical protein
LAAGKDSQLIQEIVSSSSSYHRWTSSLENIWRHISFQSNIQGLFVGLLKRESNKNFRHQDFFGYVIDTSENTEEKSKKAGVWYKKTIAYTEN